MMKSKFDIFSYQITPISNIQLDLFGEFISYENLVQNKNRYFLEVLNSPLHFYKFRYSLNYKIEYSDDEFTLLRLANKKRVTIEKDFHKESFDSEPSCLIAVYNNPGIQIIAIESDKTSFGNSALVLNIIEKVFDRKLLNYSLTLNIQPKYEEQVLWNLLTKYEGRVEKLQFQFAKPNLARINASLSEELKKASRDLNSSVTKLEFDAGEEQVLENLNQENKELANLVHASSEGAGPAKIKLKKIRRWESTENSVKSIEVEGIEIESDTNAINNFVNQLKDILKSE